MGFLNDTNRDIDNWMPKWQCTTMMGMKVTTIAVHGLFIFLLAILCNFLHLLLRPFSQPRFVSEIIVGISISNIPFIRKSIGDELVTTTLNYMSSSGMICHMFISGLEIDTKIFLQLPVRETKVAASGILTTLIIGFFTVPRLQMSTTMNTKFDLGIVILLSGTTSSILSRLITDLKISKSDIGQFVVLAGVISDLLSYLLLSMGFALYNPIKDYSCRDTETIIRMTLMVILQAVMSAKLAPMFFTWVNNENPQGKTMKGSYLVLSIAFVLVVSSFSPVFGDFDKILSAFLAGLFMPREGRIAKLMISKFKNFFGTFFYPLFFFWAGMNAELSKLETHNLMTWVRMGALFFTVTVGKTVGTVASGVLLGFHLPDSIAIGLLLSMKGHFQIYLAIACASAKVPQITVSTSIAIIVVTFLSIIYTPLVVQNIIKRARKRSPTQRMALQWLNPENEFRILLCVRGAHNASSAINIVEISRGSANPGVMVYMTDMVELTDKIAATLTQGDGVEAVSVTDAEVVKMREEVGIVVQRYLDEDGAVGVSLRRMLALCPLANMQQDICILAEDLLATLIILPFHKEQQADGSLSIGNPGFRNVNRKVLRYAPCSVGILVDRGLGSTKVSRKSISLNTAIIFIGGTDDREALAYAGRVANHPGVKLTVIRFLLDNNADSVSSRINRARANTPEHEEEMKLDDEYFAEFYDEHVAGGHVAYMEKYLANSGQTFATLRSLQGQYALFIVGRGGRLNTVLTAGMNDWEECPELGPIGDILSTSEFSVTASVLIIQQHSLRGELHGVHDQFTIM